MKLTRQTNKDLPALVGRENQFLGRPAEVGQGQSWQNQCKEQNPWPIGAGWLLPRSGAQKKKRYGRVLSSSHRSGHIVSLCICGKGVRLFVDGGRAI